MFSRLESHHRTLSGSSLDLRSSSQNASPVGSLQMGGFQRQLPGGTTRHFEKGHRVCKSMGNSELGYQTKTCDPEVQSAKDFTAAVAVHTGVVTSLSYSLDKGLDEYEEIKKAENTLQHTEATITNQQRATGNLAHVGSEPILTQNLNKMMVMERDHDTASSSDEAQKCFLQNWQAYGPAPVCSDEDTDILHNSTGISEQNFSNIHMGMNESREQTIQQNDFDTYVVQMRPQGEDVNGSSQDHSLQRSCIPLPAVHNINSAEDSVCVNLKNVHWKSDIMSTVDKDNMQNGSRVTHENAWGVEELAAFYSTQNESPVGGQKLNSFHTSTSQNVTAVNSSLTAGLKINKKVGPKEDSTFSDAYKAPGDPVLREECSEAVGMKQLSCTDNSELEKLVGLGDILEGSIVDSVLTRRTEALASRTASFNLVRTRHSSSLEDAPS